MSGVFQNIDPPPPLHPASVSSPRTNILEDDRHRIGLLQYNLSTGKLITKLSFLLTYEMQSLIIFAIFCGNFYLRIKFPNLNRFVFCDSQSNKTTTKTGTWSYHLCCLKIGETFWKKGIIVRPQFGRRGKLMVYSSDSEKFLYILLFTLLLFFLNKTVQKNLNIVKFCQLSPRNYAKKQKRLAN
jgi:hypothetical protein